MDEQPKSDIQNTKNILGWKILSLRIAGGYILVSIISQIFSPYPVGSNWTLAEKFVGSALGYLLQFLCIFIVFSIIAILVARIPKNNRAKPLSNFINSALIATLVIAGLLIIGGWYGNKRLSELSSSRQTLYKQDLVLNESKSPQDRAKVIAAITRQDSEGGTSDKFDQVLLRNFESWIIETILKKGKNRFEELGYDPNKFNPKVNANSVYLEVSGEKLAIIKIRFEDVMRSVSIIGIKGNELIRVTCFRYSNHDIPVFAGECGNKVNEAFGIPVQP